MRRAGSVMRERIEDSKAEGPELQREPGYCPGLVLDEWKGRSKDLLEA